MHAAQPRADVARLRRAAVAFDCRADQIEFVLPSQTSTVADAVTSAFTTVHKITAPMTSRKPRQMKNGV